MKKIILIILASFLIIGIVFVIKNQKNNKTLEQESIVSKVPFDSVKKTLKIGQVALNVEIADTYTKREQGLSGKTELTPNEAMLFVFDTEGYYGIWMKDMNFAIDIAWLDQNKKIIFMEKAVQPETYPTVFYAKKNDLPILSLYVLEMPVGFLNQNNIQIGDLVDF